MQRSVMKWVGFSLVAAGVLVVVPPKTTSAQDAPKAEKAEGKGDQPGRGGPGGPGGRGGRGGGGGGGRGMMGGGRGGGQLDIVALLGAEPVRKELKLSDEVTKKIDDSVRAAQEDSREMMMSLGEADEETRTKTMEKIASNRVELSKKLLGELSTDQTARIKGIYLQVVGPLAAANEVVSADLSVTDDQKTKLKDLVKEMGDKRGEAMRAMMAAGGPPNFQEMMEANNKMEAEYNAKALELMTEDQKKKFEELKGAKFEVDRAALMPRRGPGGRGPGGAGGPGGRGGAGGAGGAGGGAKTAE